MSPNITWKGDGPLMVGGLVGGSDKCCCENPPPPECYCPGFCSYILSQISPSGFSHSVTQDCALTVFSSVINDPLEASIIQPPDGYEACTSPGYAISTLQNYFSGNGRPYLFGDLQVFRIFSRPGECGLGAYVAVFFRAYVSIQCYQAEGYKATVGWAVTGEYNVGGSYINSLFGAGAGYATKLSSTCLKLDSRHCSPQPPWHAHKWLDNTPLDIPVSWSDVSSSNDAFDVMEYVADPVLAPYLESLKNTLTATFRITSRPSCQTTECSCSASLAGVTMSLNGETFTIGNEPNPSRGQTTQTWLFTDGANPSITYEVYDPSFTEIQVRIIAELFCSSAEEDPNIQTGGQPTWYLVAYSDCFTWENGVVTEATRDTWLGAYECYEHCGEFVPSGSPYPFLRIDSETATPAVGPCDPPYAPAVTLGWSECE